MRSKESLLLGALRGGMTYVGYPKASNQRRIQGNLYIERPGYREERVKVKNMMTTMPFDVLNNTPSKK